jgi:glycosyltransferase involved in cell wall biosynthesis
MVRLTTVSKFLSEDFKFSILVPTWNNVGYLKLCLDSIRKNSEFNHQVIVFVNEGSDGTIQYLEEQDNVDYIWSEKNIGVCLALNSCRSLIKGEYIVFINDDMYLCPGWDLELYKEITTLGTDYFFLSSTPIEPYPTNNPNAVALVRNFGTDAGNFREDELLKEYMNLEKQNWQGSSWPPSVVKTDLWDMVGGLSVEYTPGMYSDPDFSMKLWKLGVRVFKGVGKSKAYHFGTKSTTRIKKKNDGSRIFLMKWGITARTFYTDYLKMGKPWDGPLPDKPAMSRLTRTRNKLKMIISVFRNGKTTKLFAAPADPDV